jgi:transposase-like protein
MCSMKSSRAGATPRPPSACAEASVEEAGLSTPADDHRQAQLLRCRPKPGDARVEHRSHKGLNNRAENTHLPFRRRERTMQGFRSPGGLQRFVSVFSAVRNLFVPPHSRRSALSTHLHRLNAMAMWKAAACVAA